MGSDNGFGDELDEVLKIFVEEAREHLATIETDLLAIEEGGADIDEVLVNKVFRAAHSIKGGSGFFGLEKIKELAHKAETVLDMVRSRKMAPNSEVVNILLAAFDQLRDMINNTGQSEQANIADLVVSLTGMASSYLPAAQKDTLRTQVTLSVPGSHETVVLPQLDFDRVKREGRYLSLVDCDLIHDVEQRGLNVLVVFNELSQTGEVLDCVVDYAAVGTLDAPVGNRIPLRLVIATAGKPADASGFLSTITPDCIHVLMEPKSTIAASVQPVIQAGGAPPLAVAAPEIPLPTAIAAPVTARPVTLEHAAVEPALAKAATLKAETTSSGPQAAGDETIRVNVHLLENLMNLAGELVLSRNQLRSAIAHDNRELLASADQRVNQVTTELQDVIMQTRLQPIGNVFVKFNRLVRDLSQSLGKEIQLEILGKDVALDKTMIEGLSDPLTHMVRNSVDHGIESASERIAAGKKAAGKVRIEARHEAGMIVVEIADDGKGIDPEKVAAAAIRKGLITAEKAQGLSDRDKQALIFLPGLSTVQIVSDVSGRGVGMDVVKTNLDRLGGQVEIISEIGKGSMFRIKLPLTLAIIPSLIISMDSERFAIPQANIEELLRLRPEELKNRIEIVGDSEVLLLRDRMLPLARFSDILGAVPSYEDITTGRREIDRRALLADRRSPRHNLVSADKEFSSTTEDHEPSYVRGTIDRRHAAASILEVAVVTTGTMSFGLVVSSFHDTEEVVVKPLGSRLKHLREYSGATILGDGTVALILDVAGIAAKAGLASVSGSARAARLAAEAEAQLTLDIQSLLLFNNGPDEPCAIPLDLVLRIERVRPEQIERLGKLRTMQYRGASLPLLALSDAASVASVEAETDLVVLVASANGHEVGLLGSMPVDVIETGATIDQHTHRQKGIAGSAILRERTTLIADLYELVDVVHPDWAGGQNERGRKRTGGSTTVLLAEDSDFFRSQMKKYLEEDGFAVLTAPDGEAAWELLLGHLDTVRMVVTDIEMPRLTGLGLASRIRAEGRTATLPIIAVSSLAGDEDAARGRAAGISEYQVKLDRDKLLSSVRAYESRGTTENRP